MSIVDVRIPYTPRTWAKALHASQARFGALVLHRRAGKTTAVMNHHLRAALDDDRESRRLKALRADLTDAMLRELVNPAGGRHYGHILPLHTQAKSVAWDKLKFYACVVPGVKFNESELLVRLPNGHKVQLFGADNPDAFRGMAFSGLSFDEFSQMAPNVFSEVLSKALADHLGYAWFLGTIKGKDHLFKTYEAAKDSAEWFSLWQDIDRSLASEEGVTIQVLQTAMEDDRKLVKQGLMTEDEFEQEWYLSTDAAIQGAFYLKEMSAASKQGRITNVPYDPSLLVDTDWDLGMVDAMAVVYSQTLRSGEVRIIDYHEAEGEALPYHIRQLRERPYVYGKHYPPHDATVKELGSGKSRVEVARELGLHFEWPDENPGVQPGIEAVRLMLPKCWFDAAKTARLVECLRNYRKAFNSRLNEFTGVPVHNWACFAPETEVLTRYGTYRIMDLPENGEVLTPCGWKQYEGPRVTRRDASLVMVEFEDGLTVRCTPDHTFLTESGWRSADSLAPGSLIRSALTHSASTSMVASIGSGPRSAISHAAESAFTAMYGRLRSVQSRMDATYTIATETLSGTLSQILSAFPRLSTYESAGPFGVRLTSLLPREARRPSGMPQMRAERGTAGTLSVHRAGRNGSARIGLASTAGQSSTMRLSERVADTRSIAPIHARLLRIASVRLLPERLDTWCIHVPDVECFALANGAIAHNSHGADAFRGLAVRHKIPSERQEAAIYPLPTEYAYS